MYRWRFMYGLAWMNRGVCDIFIHPLVCIISKYIIVATRQRQQVRSAMGVDVCEAEASKGARRDRISSALVLVYA